MTNPPLSSPRIWHDGTSLFLELADSHCLAFPFSEAGLSKALKLIPKCQDHGTIVLNSPSLATHLIDKGIKQIKVAKATKLARLRIPKDSQLEADIDEVVRNLERK